MRFFTKAHPVYSGDVVYTCSDEHGVIDVVDEKTVRSLQFGTTARQSTMFLEKPACLALVYTHCLMTGLLFADPPQRALMLGLGGGSVAKFLLDQLPDIRVDVVEKRPRIVEVAREFFSLPQEGRLRVLVDDGLRFLQEQEPEPYHLLIVDLHDSSGMAPVVQRPDFFPACTRRLTDEGIMTINLWYGFREEEERLVRQNLESAFEGRVLYLPVAGKRNCIALAFKAESFPEVAAARLRADEWKERTGVDFPGLLKDIVKRNGALST